MNTNEINAIKEILKNVGQIQFLNGNVILRTCFGTYRVVTDNSNSVHRSIFTALRRADPIKHIETRQTF